MKMETQGKITDKVREKCLEIMDIALSINVELRSQERTGDKPTIFVEFYGHTAQLNVRFFRNGYKFNNFSESEKRDIYLIAVGEYNRTEESVLRELDKVIEELKSLEESQEE